MKVILKTDVDRLGHMGDLVEVKPGYARNYLLPQDIAMPATTRSVKILEHEKRVIADRIRKEKGSAEGTAGKIEALSLVITAQVGEEGKLFGSVTTKDVAEALVEAGVAIDKRRILLDKPIKEIGASEIPIKIHREVTATLKIEVVAQTDNS